MPEITKAEFDAYEIVRKSGLCNMITQANLAAQAAGLPSDRYWLVLKNYATLATKFKERDIP